MGVEGLNTIVKQTPSETPRKYNRIVIDGSNLIFNKLASSVSQLKKRFLISQWLSIDKDVIYQTKFIINNTFNDIKVFLTKLIQTYNPREIYIVMDPKVTPKYKVNSDMIFVNDVTNNNFKSVANTVATDVANVMPDGQLKDNAFITAILNDDEIKQSETIEFNIKEEEQVKRKQQSDKDKLIEKEISKLRELDIDDTWFAIISSIYKQSYHYQNVREMLKLSNVVLLLIEREFRDGIYIIDAQDEADLVIKSIVYNNIRDIKETLMDDDFMSYSDDIDDANDANDTASGNINDTVNDVASGSINVDNNNLNDVANITSTNITNDHTSQSHKSNLHSSSTRHKSSANPPSIATSTPPSDSTKNYTLVISADTDYYILFSDTPYVHCRALQDTKIYSPYKCWKRFLGDAYSYDVVIRISALFGNDYTIHQKIINANTRSSDAQSLFNIDEDHKFISLADNNRTTICKVIKPFIRQYQTTMDHESPTPVTFIDNIIHDYDISYFRKYFLSTIIYKNWRTYNRCTYRHTNYIDRVIQAQTNKVIAHLHSLYTCIYTWSDINLLFTHNEQFITTINEEYYETAAELIERYNNTDEQEQTDDPYNAADYLD